jgi:predicted nucleotidyltransferase
MMTKNIKDLLRVLNAHAVKYLVVGGYAYGVHLEPRATKDLDLFIRTDEENSKALFAALAEFGAPLSGLTPADFRDGTVFQLGQTPERVDILQRIDGITFDEAWEHRIEGVIDGEVPTAVISRDDFIRNKLASGREQDILDVKKLQASALMRAAPSPRPKRQKNKS